jgi:hypothetical protein
VALTYQTWEHVEKDMRRATHLKRWLAAGLSPEETVDATAVFGEEMPLLALALRSHDAVSVSMLLDHGANPNRRYGPAATPLSLHALPADPSVHESAEVEAAMNLMGTYWARITVARAQMMSDLVRNGMDPGLSNAAGDNLLKRARPQLTHMPALLAKLEAAHLSYTLPPSEHASRPHRL